MTRLDGQRSAQQREKHALVDPVPNESLVRREPPCHRDLLNHPPNILKLRAGLADADRFVETFAGAGDQVEVLLRNGGADRVCG